MWSGDLPWRPELVVHRDIVTAGPPPRWRRLGKPGEPALHPGRHAVRPGEVGLTATPGATGSGADVVVIGAGIVGAACAYHLAAGGLAVTVVERGSVAAGTTGAGEGDILVSDKGPGPELDLALLSARRWRELGDELGGDVELEPKGGLVVGASEAEAAQLRAFAGAQAAAGVDIELVSGGDLVAREPHIAPDLAGGVFYPQDQQVQPMLAAARLLEAARRLGARVRLRTEVVGFETAPGPRVTGVRTTAGVVAAGVVVNASGTWAGEVAALAGVDLPVLPRRGFVLVTEALPPLVHHKVFSADYVANVASAATALESSAVVEGTRSGTVLIGASRERVGFDRTPSLAVLGRLAAQAVRLFPVLAEARAIRYYTGFRPYCPDHLPVIGPDPRLDGLVHACGHEGAGVGLAPGTAVLVADTVLGRNPAVALAPFRPDRFACDPEVEPTRGHR
jgi:glycine/D-amino acid oxidase-like deaminating enzyme